jgi:hypothetical protein
MADQFDGLSEDFSSAAAQAERQDLVLLDKDVAAWFRGQGNMARQVNDLCRFYMDTYETRVFEFDPDEPTECSLVKADRPETS